MEFIVGLGSVDARIQTVGVVGGVLELGWRCEMNNGLEVRVVRDSQKQFIHAHHTHLLRERDGTKKEEEKIHLHNNNTATRPS